MEDQQKYFAAVRLYGDTSYKSIFVIEASKIKDFVPGGTFDYNIPHFVYKLNVVTGEDVPAPAQVFCIEGKQFSISYVHIINYIVHCKCNQ